MRIGKAVFLALILGSVSTSVLAQDWIAERLRGGVMQFEHGSWVALERGDIVLDGQKIRTSGDGRVELVRGLERIALDANTEISIRDAAGQKMTSVVQTLGSVTIEAERRNVQHFSVQTPVLAAVVKGTQFTVTYRNGQARVDVERGVVQVQDSIHDMVVDVTPGQSAAARQTAPLDVTGPGSDKVVYMIEGEVVPAAARDAVLSGALAAEDALAAVKSRAVPNANASVNAGGQGNSVSAGVRANNGNGNGVSVGVGVGSNNAGGNGNGKGVSVSVGVGNAGNGNTNANGGGNSNAGGNGNGNANGHDKQASVEVDLGVASVGVSVGNGLKLGLGLGN